MGEVNVQQQWRIEPSLRYLVTLEPITRLKDKSHVLEIYQKLLIKSNRHRAIIAANKSLNCSTGFATWKHEHAARDFMNEPVGLSRFPHFICNAISADIAAQR